MQTRREALVAQGLAKPGRGKFSKDALAWLETQRAQGVKFSDDDAPVKPVKPTGDDKPAPEPKPKDPRDTPVLFPDEYRFPENLYQAVRFDGKTRIVYSMREACNTCSYSLTNHLCETPKVHGFAVTIEKR